MHLVRAHTWLTAGTAWEAAGAAAAIALVVSSMAWGAWSMHGFGASGVIAHLPEPVIAEAPAIRRCDLPTFSILLEARQRSGRQMMLKITSSLELDAPFECAQVMLRLPQIQQAFGDYFRRLRIEDLQGRAGLYRLRMEMLWLVSEVLATTRVKDVLFKEMLVQ